MIKDLGWVVFRPSGTEPKLKIYISVNSKDLEEAKKINISIYESLLKLVETKLPIKSSKHVKRLC